jgi:hypothetical protein
MYLVVSFGFGLESEVSIHSLTPNLQEAESIYRRVLKKANKENGEDPFSSGCMLMVELLKIPSGFQSQTGFTLFWGQEPPAGVQIIKGNNRDPEELTPPETVTEEVRRMSLE